MCEIGTFSVPSPLGSLLVHSCPDGLHSISISKEKSDEENEAPQNKQYNANDSQCVNWFRDYFKAAPRKMFPRLCFKHLGKFDRQVYTELMKVPFGKCVSYSDLSEALCGSRNKARAIGSSMARNPWIIMVPCHRVIKQSGDIGSYSGGFGVKNRLIEFEKSGKWSEDA